MRILHATPTYYPAFKYGGPINSTHTINKKLIQKNIDLTVYTSTDGQADKKIYNQTKEVDGVNVTYFKSYGETGYGISIKFVLSLIKNIKHYDVVLITSAFTFTSFITPLICLLFKKPYIYSSRGTLDPYAIKVKSSLIKNMALTLYERYFLNKSSNIIALTQEESNWLRELKIKNPNVSIIPNGIDIIDTENFHKKDFFNQEKKVLLYFGRLNHKKNVHLIIKVYKKLIEKYQNLELKIAGPDDGAEQYLKNLTKELNLENHVNFLGLIKGEDKETLLKQSNIFILPSLSEGISMAQLEAMKNKCTVIVGNRGGIYNDLIKYNAGIVIEPDEKNLLKELEILLEDNKKCLEIAENGFNLVKKKYTWEKVVNSYIELYKKVSKNEK